MNMWAPPYCELPAGLLENSRGHPRTSKPNIAERKTKTGIKMYDKLFARISRMWVTEKLDSPELESWKTFCARIDRGIQAIRDRPERIKRIVVFTSAA